MNTTPQQRGADLARQIVVLSALTFMIIAAIAVSYTHLTLPTIYSV